MTKEAAYSDLLPKKPAKSRGTESKKKSDAKKKKAAAAAIAASGDGLTLRERRSIAAKKAAATREHRPRMRARDIWSILATLENDLQPWFLMKYRYELKFAPGTEGVCYEVVIWQTAEGDYSYDRFEVDAQVAREIREQYGLTERKRFKKDPTDRLVEGAVIYAKNDRLQDLRLRYKREVSKRRAQANKCRALYFAMQDCAFLFKDEENKARYDAVRDMAADAEQEILAAIPDFEREFLRRENIIIYNL